MRVSEGAGQCKYQKRTCICVLPLGRVVSVVAASVAAAAAGAAAGAAAA